MSYPSSNKINGTPVTVGISGVFLIVSSTGISGLDALTSIIPISIR